MIRQSLRRIGVLAVGLLLACAGVGGIANHMLAQAASHPHVVATHGLNSGGAAVQDIDASEQHSGANTQRSAADVDELGTNTEESGDIAGVDADAAAPCSGSGTTQTGNCDTQSQSDTVAGD